MFVLGVRMLFGGAIQTTSKRQPLPRKVALPVLSNSTRATNKTFDILTIPIIGRFLHWRYARLSLQLPMALLAAPLIYDGLTGPSVAPMNLAGILPWIHWRAFVILGLLVAGNVFCLGCPFLLPRNLSRFLFHPRYSWPRVMRTKWLAVLLLVLFFWSYEVFALWDSPWLTAWIAIAYFSAALIIDGLFREASFCKFVCPIGQFHFVQSLLSPLSVQVRESNMCQTCTTKDCIRGRKDIVGCELNLYLPQKVGNMDCTMCLDCIHACPHDNIGILPRNPATELWQDSNRSGMGRFSRRLDIAVLLLVLTFVGFANAAGMTAAVSILARIFGAFLRSVFTLVCSKRILFYHNSLITCGCHIDVSDFFCSLRKGP